MENNTQTDNRPLNSFIPKESIIRSLAKEKRDLQIENLDLKQELQCKEAMIALLQEDNAALMQHGATAAPVVTYRDINKAVNKVEELHGQLGKKLGIFQEHTEAMQKLYGIMGAFLEAAKQIKPTEQEDNEDNL